MEILGRKFLLTYPQSNNLSKERVMAHLQDISEIEYAVVGQEDHHVSDGIHFHALVIYKKRIHKQGNIFSIGDYVCNVKMVGRKNVDLKNTINYVIKDGDFIEEGVKPKCMEKLDRKDKLVYALMHTNKECINSGYFSLNEIIHLDAFRIKATDQWPMWKKRYVYWLYGPTGCGKTRTAHELLTQKYEYITDIWIASGDLRTFFNGYMGQKAVILDDLRPGSIQFEKLLRILDGYRVTVNVKGGYVEWLAEVIFITAPVEPVEMYINRETGQEWDHLAQLKRRIDGTYRYPRRETDTEPVFAFLEVNSEN